MEKIVLKSLNEVAIYSDRTWNYISHYQIDELKYARGGSLKHYQRSCNICKYSHCFVFWLFREIIYLVPLLIKIAKGHVEYYVRYDFPLIAYKSIVFPFWR